MSSPSLPIPRTPWISTGQLSRELRSLLNRFLIAPFGFYSVAKMLGLPPNCAVGRAGPELGEAPPMAASLSDLGQCPVPELLSSLLGGRGPHLTEDLWVDPSVHLYTVLLCLSV